MSGGGGACTISNPGGCVSKIDDCVKNPAACGQQLVDNITTAATQVRVAVVEGNRWGWKAVANALEPVFKLLGFEDKTVYGTEAVWQPLFTGEFNSYLKGTIINSVMSNTNLSEALIKYTLTSPRSNMSRAYSYALSKYVYGLPSVDIQTKLARSSSVKSILQNVENDVVSIVTYEYGSLTTPTYISLYLHFNNPSYNVGTNSITAGGNQYTYHSYQVDNELGVIVALFKYTYTDMMGTYTLELNQYIPFNNYTGNLRYVVFYYKGSETLRKLFYYVQGTGTYPELDTPSESPTDTLVNSPLGSPMAILRKGDISAYSDFDSDKNSKWYKDTTKLLDIYNINPDTLMSSIRSSKDENKVDNIFILNAVNIKDTTHALNEYLIQFFKLLSITGSLSGSQFNNLPISEKLTYRNTLTIKESDGGANFNYMVSWNYIDIDIKQGNIGKVGFTNTQTVLLPPIESEDSSRSSSVSRFIINKQITATTIETITVSGLTSTMLIPTEGGGVLFKTYTLDDATYEGIYILLDAVIYKLLPNIVTEEILQRSFHVLILAADKKELEYYQTPEFAATLKIVFDVIAIIYIVFTGDVGTAQAFVYAIAKYVLVNYILFKALEIVFKSTDNETVRAIAVAAYVAGSIYFNKGKNLIGDISTGLQALSKSINLYTGLEMEKLKEEYEADAARLRTAQEELDAAASMLGDNAIDPLQIATVNRIVYETPVNFLSRCRSDAVLLARNSTRNYVDTQRDLQSTFNT